MKKLPIIRHDQSIMAEKSYNVNVVVREKFGRLSDRDPIAKDYMLSITNVGYFFMFLPIKWAVRDEE